MLRMKEGGGCFAIISRRYLSVYNEQQALFPYDGLRTSADVYSGACIVCICCGLAPKRASRLPACCLLLCPRIRVILQRQSYVYCSPFLDPCQTGIGSFPRCVVASVLPRVAARAAQKVESCAGFSAKRRPPTPLCRGSTVSSRVARCVDRRRVSLAAENLIRQIGRVRRLVIDE